MSDLAIDVRLLEEFERQLDLRFPEKSGIPARVLGYGEISTVLEVGLEPMRGLVCYCVDRCHVTC